MNVYEHPDILRSHHYKIQSFVDMIVFYNDDFGIVPMILYPYAFKSFVNSYPHSESGSIYLAIC